MSRITLIGEWMRTHGTTVLVSLGLGIVLWYTLAVAMASQFFPMPHVILLTLFDFFVSGMIYVHILSSLKRTVGGFLLALTAASVLAFVLGIFYNKGKYVVPLVDLLRPIPPIAWIPLSILWFGIGDLSSTFIIFIAAFFPIFTNVLFGISSMPKIYHRVGQGFKLTAWQKFRHITFPYTLPYLLAGCKTSIGFAWMAVIASEMIAGNYGLGYFIEVNRVLLRPEFVIATMVIIAVIGFGMNRLIVELETRTTSWKA